MRREVEQPLSYLNEEEADAFFHEGDAGTYDGGPALSLAPVGMADLIEDDETRLLPSPEQLARRARMKRLVITVVSTLAAGSALVFALRVTRSESDTATAAPLPATAPVSAPLRAAHEVAAVPAVVAVPVLAPSVLSEEHPATVAPTAPTTPSSPVVPTRAHQAERVSVRNERAPLYRPSVQKTTAVSAGRGHSPPTANFPD